MSDSIDNLVMLHVWIHSRAVTKEPHEIDVFEVNGKVHMQWFHDALEQSNQKDLAEMFYEHLGETEASAWFLCRMCTEDATGELEHYVEVLSKIP